MRYLKIVVLLGVIFIGVLGCQSKPSMPLTEIRVGTMTGPDQQLLYVVKNVAQNKYHLDVKIVAFNNYDLPNQALIEQKVDINVFQHLPFLLMWQAKNNVHNLIPVAKTFIFPIGIYSRVINNINELPNNALIAIPNDPTNKARALLLLQSAGVIQLNPAVTINARIRDIIDNPKQIRFIQEDASLLVNKLPFVTAAIINCNYAIAAGLLPVVNHDPSSHRDALYIEGLDSLYTNIIVVQKAHVNDLAVKQFIDAFHSDQVLTAAQSIFHQAVIKAW